MKQALTTADSRRILRPLVAVLLVLGLAGIMLTAALGFEEPNHPLLVLSFALMVAPVLAVVAHVALTRVLTTAQRRIWFRQFTGRKAIWAVGEYLSCNDVGAAARRFAEDTNGAVRPDRRS